MSFASFGDDMLEAEVRRELKRVRAAMGVLATQIVMPHLDEGCGVTRKELMEAVTKDALEKADALIAEDLRRTT